MLLQIAHILCFLSYYCQGQSSNEILYTSNPIIETVTNPTTTRTTTTTTTTAAPVTYNEQNLFTSNPILVESNELPDVVPLLTNNTLSNTTTQITTTEFASNTFPPENNLLATSFPLPTEPSTVDDRFQQSVTVPRPEPPIIFSEPQQPPTVSQPEPPIIFFEPQQPSTVSQPNAPSTFAPTQRPSVSLPPKVENGNDLLPSPILPADTIQQLIELAIYNILPSRCGEQNEHTNWYFRSLSNIGEFPWLALLKYKDYQHPNTRFLCTGTLISDRYVITAANCVLNKGKHTGPITVVLGEHQISSPVDCTYNFYREECADKVVEVPVEKYFYHPEYNGSYRNNNLALLRLQTKVSFSRFIAPLCLPIKNLMRPMEGDMLVTAGWGATEDGVESDFKAKSDIPVLSDYQCSNKFYRRNFFQHQVCIGTDFKKHICRADYGGPVMSTNKNGKPQWYLEGIISSGFGFGRNGFPNTYTRISPYDDWILSTIALDTYRAI